MIRHITRNKYVHLAQRHLHHQLHEGAYATATTYGKVYPQAVIRRCGHLAGFRALYGPSKQSLS